MMLFGCSPANGYRRLGAIERERGSKVDFVSGSETCIDFQNVHRRGFGRELCAVHGIAGLNIRFYPNDLTV